MSYWKDVYVCVRVYAYMCRWVGEVVHHHLGVSWYIFTIHLHMDTLLHIHVHI